MSKRKSRDAVIAQLERLAFYRPNDGIRLAIEGEADVRRLHLEGVSEFKRHGNGTVELKFFDRIKALELLLALQQEGETPSGGVMEFLRQIGGEEP